MSDRQGVEIDYCPSCRGVWLDRGELDKLVERAGQYEAQFRGRRDDDNDDDDDERRRRYDGHRDDGGGGQGYGLRSYGPPAHFKKKKSFWSELFD